MPGVEVILTQYNKEIRAKVHTQGDGTSYIRHQGELWLVEKVGEAPLFRDRSMYYSVYKVVGKAKVVLDKWEVI